MVKTKGQQRFVSSVIWASCLPVRNLVALFELKVSAVVTGDQGDFVIAVQFANFGQEILHLVGFFHPNAVNQFSQGAVLRQSQR